MGFFGSFTGSDQRKDARSAYNDSSKVLQEGYGKAQGNLTQGYKTANSQYGQARADVNSGFTNALANVNRGVGQAVDTYKPWYDSGTQANTMYGNALGLNGAAAQQTFTQNYSQDPSMTAANDFALKAIMQQQNARGMSNSGAAQAAVAQESLRNYTGNYNSYLDRLAGVSGQGLQAANAIGNLYAGQGKDVANLYSQRGSDLANISGQRANLGYQYGQGQAALNSDLAATQAGNRINYGNALAQSRGILGNNLMGLLGTGVQAFAGGQYSAVNGLMKGFR